MIAGNKRKGMTGAKSSGTLGAWVQNSGSSLMGVEMYET